jgi:hypothetical protein
MTARKVQAPRERISEDDLSYHRQIVAQIAQALAARDSWASHLSGKYGLREGDQVAEDGRIVRAAK